MLSSCRKSSTLMHRSQARARERLVQDCDQQNSLLPGQVHVCVTKTQYLQSCYAVWHDHLTSLHVAKPRLKTIPSRIALMGTSAARAQAPTMFSAANTWAARATIRPRRR